MLVDRLASDPNSGDAQTTNFNFGSSAPVPVKVLAVFAKTAALIFSTRRPTANGKPFFDREFRIEISQ